MGKLQINGAIESNHNGQLVIDAGEFLTKRTFSGGWQLGWTFNINDIQMGKIGFYGGAEAMYHFYVGTEYTDIWMKVTPDGTITATKFVGSLQGTADSAKKLSTARTITLTGSVKGSGTFDGSGNLSIATTTNHTHSYLPLSGGSMTGNINRTTYNSSLIFLSDVLGMWTKSIYFESLIPIIPNINAAFKKLMKYLTPINVLIECVSGYNM